jgi:type II restriction enzyme
VDGTPLSRGCRENLPAEIECSPGADVIRLIDVLWIAKHDERVVAAFEVEHTTSIYSGIVRLLDLALGAPGHAADGLFLVAPDKREADVRSQLLRPAFRAIGNLRVRFLPYSELESHREAICRFGQGMKPIEAIARSLD